MEAATKPRILVLTTTLPARPGDGTPEFVLDLSRALASQYRVTLLAPRIPGAVRREVIDGVEVFRFPYFPRRWEGLAQGAILPRLKSQRWRIIEAPFLVLGFLVSALRLARRVQPEAVNAHWIVPAGFVGWSLRGLLGVPYVLTVHGADAYALGGRAWTSIKKHICNRAAVISPVSRDIARLLGIPEHDVGRLVVPMGVDMDAIRSAVGDRRPERGRFLFVGRLADKKGVDVLLQAAGSVPEARCVIVGDGPQRARLDDLAGSLGVSDRVEFRGELSHAEVFAEMARAHAVVIPSVVGSGGDSEGTPVILGESMAARVPVIASDLGGLGEQIESGVNGILVRPNSVGDLADALRRALQEDLQLLADRALHQMAGTLDLATTVRHYRSFLETARRAGTPKRAVH